MSLTFKTIILIVFSQTIFSQENQTILLVTVGKGETVTQIAKKYNVTPLDIYTLNPEARNGMKENTVLRIPEKDKIKSPSKKTAKSISKSAMTDVVVAKETSYDLAKQYETAVADLENVNPEINNELVTLTTIGEGKTRDEAKYKALRNAVEQVTGAFISSNIKVVNDDLIKDEIISVTSGNIQHFDIKNETKLSDERFSLVVESTISVGKLRSFCENKGITVEFKGDAFGANMKLQGMNKKNEGDVIATLMHQIKLISNKGFDYIIKAQEPVKTKGKDFYDNDTSSYVSLDNYYDINIEVVARMNLNMENIYPLFKSTLEGISLKKEDIENYKKQNLDYYSVLLNEEYFYLRSTSSIAFLKILLERIIPKNAINFNIDNGLTNISCPKIFEQIKLRSSKSGYYHSGFFDERYPRVDNDIPYIVRAVKANYKLSYYNPVSASSDNEKIREYLLSLTEIETKVSQGFKYSLFPEGNQKKAIVIIDLTNLESNSFEFKFVNTLNLNQISKVTEYRVLPIN